MQLKCRCFLSFIVFCNSLSLSYYWSWIDQWWLLFLVTQWDIFSCDRGLPLIRRTKVYFRNWKLKEMQYKKLYFPRNLCPEKSIFYQKSANCDVNGFDAWGENPLTENISSKSFFRGNKFTLWPYVVHVSSCPSYVAIQSTVQSRLVTTNMAQARLSVQGSCVDRIQKKKKKTRWRLEKW